MEEKSIKIKEIVIENVKNVSFGEISFKSNNEILNMIGIYGQNGSGKTTVIDILEIFKKLISRSEIERSETDLLDYEKISSINLTFQIGRERLIEYKIRMKKYKEEPDLLNSNFSGDKILILQEILSTKIIKKNARWKKLAEYCRQTSEGKDSHSLTPVSFFPNSKITHNLIDIAVSQSELEQESIIFSNVIEKSIFSSENKKMTELKICYELIKEINRKIFVYSNKISGVINAQIATPFLFSYSNKNDKRSTTTYGTIGIPAEEVALISEDEYFVFENVTSQINKVLPEIIPGIKIELMNYGNQKTNNGKNGYRVELLSNRDGNTFPFRAESDGIKKIVSLLSVLINVYNSKQIIVAIDELDSGIFEFLLGELLSVLSDGAKGQIIFTSHNLRPLEVLNQKNIIFTTADKNNRYVKARSIKDTNNLRDIYIRAVQLNTVEGSSLYNKTEAAAIQKSFRKSNNLSKSLKRVLEEKNDD